MTNYQSPPARASRPAAIATTRVVRYEATATTMIDTEVYASAFSRTEFFCWADILSILRVFVAKGPRGGVMVRGFDGVSGVEFP